MNNKFYCSTTLPYLNSVPHIGHTFEFVITDIIARFKRDQLGSENVFFNTGVDAHGLKIQQAAERADKTPLEYCNELELIWKEFCSRFQISYDYFYSTKERAHKFDAFNYFYDLKEKDYLELKTYSGKYCSGCESYKTEREIENGKCAIHQLELVETEEANWFFNLNKIKDKIQPTLIDTSLEKELAKNFEELTEISVTRKNVDWAIKVDECNTSLYVWFEALLNYQFSIQRHSTDWEEYWKDSLIICGKDNLKFQAYILPALLLANNFPQNKSVLVHGTILDSEGKKMSKSLGNVIDPIQQIERYGISPVRLYLFSLNLFKDSTYSEDELVKLWNSCIVDGLGNTISRVLHLIDLKGYSEKDLEENYPMELVPKFSKINQSFIDYRFSEVFSELKALVAHISKRIMDEKPFSKDCPNPLEILSEAYAILQYLTKFYSRIIPEYQKEFENALAGLKKVILFKRID